MGQIKKAMQERQDRERLALDYLVQIDAIGRCEKHGEIKGHGYFILENDFWPRVMADRNRGVNGPVPWAAELEARDYTDLLKEVYEEHRTDECYDCNRERDE